MQIKKLLKQVSGFVPMVLVLLVSLASVVWILSPSFFKTHDFTHIARVVEMDTAIRDGHFPPRWSKHLGYGYGMPLFHYYGPFPFFVAWVPYFLGASAILSVKFLILATQLIGTSGMYLYLRSRFGALASILGTVGFIFLPYRALDLYVRGALNELMAISLIPWLLYGIDRVLGQKKSNRRWIFLYAILLAFFLTTHNLSVLLAGPVLLVYAAIVWFEQGRKVHSLARLMVAGLLGIGLAAFYFFPSYLEKDLTRVESLTGGYSHYDHHFLYIRQLFWGVWGYGGSIFGPEDGMSFMIGIPQLGIVMAGVALIGLQVIRRKTTLSRKHWMILFFLMVFGISSFLTLFRSKPIWDMIPIMRYLQFPWRFHVLISIGVPILIAGVTSFVPRVRRSLLMYFGSALIILFNLWYFRPEELLDNPNHFYYTDPTRISREMSGILPDYQPIAMTTYPPEFVQRVTLYPEDAGELEIVVDRTHEVFARVDLHREAKVRFHIVYFPNWTLYLDGKPVEQEIVENAGYQTIDLPEGSHALSLVLEPTQTRIASDLISFGSMIIVAGGLAYARHKDD